MASFSNSWNLVKQSAAVLRQDRELLWFPFLSGICELLVIASFLIPISFLNQFDFQKYLENNNQYVGYVIFFLFYLVNFFVVTFFNVGLVYCAHKRLKGGDPTFHEGVTFAMKNLNKIFVWVLLSSTVGVILQIIADKAGIFGRIFSGIAGIAWSLVTYLIIPVLIFDNKNVTDSAKYSVELFKKTWGEQISGNFSMGIVFFLLGLIPFLAASGLVFYLLYARLFSISLLITIAVTYFVYLLSLMVISSSLQGIFTAALYMYAKDGTIPSAFSAEVIKEAFKPKKAVGNPNAAI